MLSSFKGISFQALGINLTAYPGDVELDVGRFGITAMWGDALITGLFIRLGGRERHLEWPWKVGRQLTSGREVSAGS
ncbi:hypothetical protein MCBMB27_00748 [Methylobacterium phyllosphaerae]|uniref:Uncharacterized protein n=1 Tax=Methylobacterium phyllosphaerae TaxID=418223 RepID=A0AAE8L853_9HYPH|nr:hypothetical protein [Methylobacterium phyllosphaerae]APT30039.1 hypothetical protein MCBMB27_00748 [Methylobacterium phyllosphaerae]SFH32186.1 hypothetical protein SAMN05192567_12040 [Methylobacterium phyllosphaerae]